LAGLYSVSIGQTQNPILIAVGLEPIINA